MRSRRHRVAALAGMATINRALENYRARTGDRTLGVAVNGGRARLQRVTYRPDLTVDIQPVTDWISILHVPAAIAAL